ncbi:ATP-binding protein [Paenibacillus cremeus]|uniref:histidine kinase n=1 Tax=Paenibacillus cremeus TaxID=2163881 RepID=A0A559JHR1_9BACL|nr:sensor histidine kinase [Paenibacillus cremeus]TVX99411.1 sensor histidine kinase [Paenibacillus cremeus]
MIWMNQLKLRTKINLLVFLIVGVVVLLTIASIEYLTIERQFDEAGQRALMLARTTAALPETVQAFASPDSVLKLQTLVETIRQKTGAQFIVIADMDQIRIVHPSPSEIGKHMVGEDNGLVLEGQDSITMATGTLGRSIRGKTPIRDASGQQIGIVSVGFLVTAVWRQIGLNLLWIASTGFVALLCGLLGAYLLSGSIKKQLFNMEPFEIAYLAREQSAILESIREGIIAVNSHGDITTCNHEASKMIGLDAREVIGEPIRSILPHSRLPEVLLQGTPHYDQPMIIGNTLVVVNRVPVTTEGRVIGAVASFRDKQQLDQISHRMSDIGRYVDTIRSQRHEFMNKLHLISGLIEMKDYELAKNIIEEVNHDYQSTLDFFLAHIKDPAIVGILIGKLHKAKELSIPLHIDPSSSVPNLVSHRELVITFLGNTIENAFEAINAESETAARKTHPDADRQADIKVYLYEEPERLTVSVRDTGPGIDPALGRSVLQDGVSTKGEGRGTGLALVQRLAANAGGTISVRSSSEGTELKMILPKEGVEKSES